MNTQRDSASRNKAADNPWRIKPKIDKKAVSKEADDASTFTKGERLTAIGILLLFVAVSLVAVTYYLNARAKTGDLQEKGRQIIADMMRDPSSAQFRNVVAAESCVTGEVNGKNGFGGYAGFQQFYYDDARGVGQIEPNASFALSVDAARLNDLAANADFQFAYSNCQASKPDSEAVGAPR